MRRARHLLALVVLPFALAAAACGAPAEDEATSSTSGEALTTITPSASKVEGIDVSHYQGTIDWKAEKAKGRLFGVASVGDGSYEDPTFAENWKAMKAAGVIRGAYQYFEPGEDPIAQADIVVAKVGKLGDGDLPATIDVEKTGGQTAATIATNVGKWLARVEAGTGKKPIIYTGPYFWEDNVKSTKFGSYPLWIADYGVSKPLIPAGWTKLAIWQYSDSNGALDLDRFQGTLDQLKTFAGTPTTQPKTSDGGAPDAGPEPAPAPSDPSGDADAGDGTGAGAGHEAPVNASLPPDPSDAQGGCTISASRTTSSTAPIAALVAIAFAITRRVRSDSRRVAHR